ncbi:MAG TPA: site-2 protease family protein [Thermoanaerobaculia bacterium]|nr:site-2 protease family protein [Thermoanaerobaculia bacterium]
MGYLETFALLSLLIIVHEAGHFAAARLMGIPISGFSVGLGPKLWSRRWGRTEYSWRALPLGGFVMPEVADESEFRAIPLKRRLIYFLGGPLANLAVAVPLFGVLNAVKGGSTFYSIAVAPFGQVLAFCGQMLSFLPQMFAQPAALSGVVGIVVEGGHLAKSGMLLELAISLSISLAVLNLLPLPVLDGGQILMGCLEEAFPRMVRLRPAVTLVGILFLAGVMIYANVHDVVRYWG